MPSQPFMFFFNYCFHFSIQTFICEMSDFETSRESPFSFLPFKSHQIEFNCFEVILSTLNAIRMHKFLKSRCTVDH